MQNCQINHTLVRTLMTSDIDVKSQQLHSNEQERHGIWTWEGLISNHDDSPNDLKLIHLIVPVSRTSITYSSKNYK